MLLKSLHYPIIIYLDPLMQRSKPYVKGKCHILGLDEWRSVFLPVGGHAVAGSRQEIISPRNDNESGLGVI